MITSQIGFQPNSNRSHGYSLRHYRPVLVFGQSLRQLTIVVTKGTHGTVAIGVCRSRVRFVVLLLLILMFWQVVTLRAEVRRLRSDMPEDYSIELTE